MGDKKKPTIQPEYVSPPGAAELLNTSVQHLANLRHRGEGPPYSKMGKSIRYLITDLREYMRARRIVPRPVEGEELSQ